MANLPTEKELAPHGRDDDGEPKAPYGYLVNGLPRRSNRGARAGQGKGKPTSRKSPGSSSALPDAPAPTSKTDIERRDALIYLGEMLVVTPLVAASVAPPIRSAIGDHQAGALAGDGVIIAHFLPAVADGLVVLSQTKPNLLSWLDRMDDGAPWILLAHAGFQLSKALVGNHLRPDPRLNAAGLLLLQVRAAEMAQKIEDAAAAMDLQTGQAA
jgi:hypothetical protein